MKHVGGQSFAHIPYTVQGHFVMTLYAAVYHLLNHIRRLSDVGGEQLDAVFTRYPFLAGYFAEMGQHLPDDLTWGEGAEWWQTEMLAWEARCDRHLPLRALSHELGLDFVARLALMLTGLVEEDSRFGTLFAELQEPLGHRRPTLELVGHILSGADTQGRERDAWAVCQPLLASGLIEPINLQTHQAPRSEWVLRVPALLWDAARGELEARPAPGYHYYPAETFPAIEQLMFLPEFLHRLEKVPDLVKTGKVRTLVLRSDPGADPQEVLGVLAKRLGCGLLSVEGSAATDEQRWELFGPLCTMTRALPVVRYDLGPGETVALPPLAGYAGPVGVILGYEGGLSSRSTEKILSLSLPLLGNELRRCHWHQVLNGREGEELDAIAGTFHLSGGYIRQVGQMAVAHAGLDGRESVQLADVREASRSLNRQLLDTLASRLEAHGAWHDLVATENTTAKLTELAQRCRYRERLLDHLGPAFGNAANRGVRALFTGVSGTGKTLAAKILAAELGMDLYRVDLAAVINKYIGETEKNLHQVLAYAEALDVILLLDEGDTLLGSRTQIKSANDRYANLETNYLLQRLETYQGIVVVTTNLVENIDRAFQRRMDVVVPFFSPQHEERWQILQLHLPLNHSVEPAYLEQVALRCILTGGQLRNIVLHATLLALDKGESMTRRHLEEALKSEYRKAGGIFPIGKDKTESGDRDGGMAAFVDALQTH